MTAVYVLGTVENGSITLAGTAFAITPRHVITAHHNIYDEITRQDCLKCAISREVKKVNGTFIFQDPLYMTLLCNDVDADWDILELGSSHSNFILTSRIVSHFALLMNYLI